MGVSLKCQYGLRALFELGKRNQQALTRLTEIADAQAIPGRFLENILNQLRQGGFVESRRGKDGGFALARHPRDIVIGDIIRFFEGPLDPVDCSGDNPTHKCPMKGRCVFIHLWDDARRATEAVYDSKTLQDLIEAEQAMQLQASPVYMI